jgi:hypothetical protein
MVSEVASECSAVYNTSCLMCDVVFGGVFVRLAFLDAALNDDALKLKCRFRLHASATNRVPFVSESHCVKSSRLHCRNILY